MRLASIFSFASEFSFSREFKRIQTAITRTQITIRPTIKDPWVRIELSRNSKFYSIKIVDSGTPKQIQEDDTLPFTTSKGPLATGLGLSIVRSHLNHMGTLAKLPYGLNETSLYLIPSQ